MNIADVLSDKGRRAITAQRTMRVDEAARTLVEYRIGYLVVVDDQGNVIGVLSERDIIRGVSQHGAQAIQMNAGDLMTADPVICAPNDDPTTVLQKMNQRGFRHMPVVEDRKLKGIVSSRDIIKHLLDRANMDHKTIAKLNELGIY